MKPLFIPLRTEYFEAFADGSITEELRLYGPRWNENTSVIGREVVISKDYGKYARMTGVVIKFKKQHRTLDVEIACISIAKLKPQ